MTRHLKSWLAAASVLSSLSLLAVAPTVHAETLMQKAKAGKTIRIGFANEVPWAYPGEGNKPLGFVNTLVIRTLKEMGFEKIEPVVTDWGGLIPGLKAKRYDIITGGMYITKKRCANVAFSAPIGVFSDIFVVPTGNPKQIQTYADIKKSGAKLVTGTGYNIVGVAKTQGVPKAQVMTVPGPTEMLAALLAGRADVIGTNYFNGKELAAKSGGKAETTDPANMPESTRNWVGIAFRKDDADFLKAYNAAQAKLLGTPDLMASVAEYGYGTDNLPGDTSTAYACKNR